MQKINFKNQIVLVMLFLSLVGIQTHAGNESACLSKVQQLLENAAVQISEEGDLTRYSLKGQTLASRGAQQSDTGDCQVTASIYNPSNSAEATLYMEGAPSFNMSPLFHKITLDKNPQSKVCQNQSAFSEGQTVLREFKIYSTQIKFYQTKDGFELFYRIGEGLFLPLEKHFLCFFNWN